MAVRRFTSTLVLSLLLFSTACSSTSEVANGTQTGGLLPGDQPVAHPVHSGELLVAMADLEELALEQLSESLESDTARATQLYEIEHIAGRLAASVAALPHLLHSPDLPSDSRLRFQELAGQLGRDVRSLNDRAASGEVESAREEREVLLETCNACHAEFRVMPTAAD